MENATIESFGKIFVDEVVNKPTPWEKFVMLTESSNPSDTFTAILIIILGAFILYLLILSLISTFDKILNFFKKIFRYLSKIFKYLFLIKNINFSLRSCSECKKKHFLLYKNKGKDYCKKCFNEKFKICSDCGKVLSERIIKRHNGKDYCKKCFKNNIKKCHNCGELFHINNLKDYGGYKYCDSCYSTVRRSFEYIHFKYTPIDSDKFEINPYKRYCGVEIECINKHKNANCFIKEELKDLCFNQSTDSSIYSGFASGLEFQSLPMKGDNLFKKITNFCNKLKLKDYFVNTSCGLHVHFECDPDIDMLKKLYLFYSKFEKHFFKMLPQSRQNTHYCDKFKIHYNSPNKCNLKKFMGQIKTIQDFKKMVYEGLLSDSRSHYSDKRYCWVNFHSVFYRGTLEIRNHAGTIDSNKIKNWITLHLKIIDYLNGKTVQEVYDLKPTQDKFLGLFDKELQNYIKRRWNKFRFTDDENSYKEKKSVTIEELLEDFDNTGRNN